MPFQIHLQKIQPRRLGKHSHQSASRLAGRLENPAAEGFLQIRNPSSLSAFSNEQVLHGWKANTKLRHPASPGNRMSPPNSESAAFEISTTAREATQTAIETRSEFRYRFDASVSQQTQARRPRPVIPNLPMARQRPGLGERARPLARGVLHFLLHWARVHQRAPPRAELKRMRPQAGGCFDKSGARRTRQRPRAGTIPGTMHRKRGIQNFDHISRDPTKPPSKLVPSSATKSARLPPHRSRFAVDLRMAVALWAKWGSGGFPAMRKAMGRGQDV